MSANCELSRRAARLRGDDGAKNSGAIGNRDDITGEHGRRDCRIALLGRIDQAVEGGTVAAGRAVHPEAGFDRIVVPVHDMGHRIHGERQQQADERGS